MNIQMSKNQHDRLIEKFTHIPQEMRKTLSQKWDYTMVLLTYPDDSPEIEKIMIKYLTGTATPTETEEVLKVIGRG